MPQSDDFKPEWVEAMRVALLRNWPADSKGQALVALRTIRDLLERDGWQVVPRKPSEAQWEDIAANAVAHPESNYMQRARQMWPELLAAAPSPWSAGDE